MSNKQKPVAFQFSRKVFPELSDVRAWAEASPNLYGRVVQRDNEFYFGMSDFDESDVDRKPVDGVPGVTALFAKTVKGEGGKDMKTVDLPNMEICGVGKWIDSMGRTVEITEAALNSTVDAQSIFDAPVKLGHDKTQPFKKTDGLPSIGWVRNLRVKAGKLIGDLKDVPKKVADLIAVNGFKNRSAEIHFNVPDPNTSQRFAAILTGVALLGENLPAVNNLTDYVALYSSGVPDGVQISVFTYSEEENNPEKNSGGGNNMPDTSKIEELSAKLGTALARIEKLESDNKSAIEKETELSTALADKDKEIVELKKSDSEKAAKLTEKEKAEKADADKAEKANIVEFTTKLAEKLAPKFHEPYLKLFSASRENADDRAKLVKEISDLPEASEFASAITDPDSEKGGEVNDETDPVEKDIHEFCTKHGLDYNNADDYAAAATSTLKVVKSYFGAHLPENAFHIKPDKD